MKTRALLAVALLTALALAAHASAAGTNPFDSKKHVTLAIDEVSKFYNEIGYEYYYARQIMVEMGNQETLLGKARNTYYTNEANVGWAQFNKGRDGNGKGTFFEEVVNRLKDPVNKKRLEALKAKKWRNPYTGAEFSFDPTTIKLSELGTSDYEASVKSAVFCRETLFRYPKINTPDQVPRKFEDRAWWWVCKYNTGKECGGTGAGTKAAYMSTNTDASGKWIYAGTTQDGLDKYFAKGDESKYLRGDKTANVVCVNEGTRNFDGKPGLLKPCPQEGLNIIPGIEMHETPQVPIPASSWTFLNSLFTPTTVSQTFFVHNEPTTSEAPTGTPENYDSKEPVTANIENIAYWYHDELDLDAREYGVVYQTLVELGLVETGLGTKEGTYGGSSSVAGWAAINQSVLDAVQGNLRAEFPEIAKKIKDKWGFDPIKLKLADLNKATRDADRASAVVMIEFILLGGDVPSELDTLDGRAEFWSREYKSLEGDERDSAIEDYINTNTIKDRNQEYGTNEPREWVYAGTVNVDDKPNDLYFMRDDEQKYFDRDESTRAVFFEEWGEKEFRTYACVSRSAYGSADFYGGCLWVSFCNGDAMYSRTAAGELADYLRASSAFTNGDFAIGGPSVQSPGGYIRGKADSSGRNEIPAYKCTKTATVHVMYPGCEGLKPKLEEISIPGFNGICIDVDEESYERIYSFIVQGGPGEHEGMLGLAESVNKALTSLSIFKRLAGQHMSVYMTRVYKDFIKSGTAYQFLPADLVLNNTLNVSMRHEGKDFSHGDGIFVYRYEDWEINESCNMTVLGEASKPIASTGGSVGLGDVKLDFSAGAVPDGTVITIRKLELDCGEKVVNITPPNGNITPNGTIIKTGQGGVDILLLLIVAVASAIVGIIVYSQIEARGKGKRRKGRY